ncbi:GAP family protein [Microbacteriaceae bacterium VKM Ac-2854]|nr:GAP family protein [Microbacteriaceae bacterium VKM Ac-2854]
MSVGILASLAGLALLDSVSVGTLVIPVALLLQARIRIGHIASYLGAVAVFYTAVGVLLLGAADGLRGLDLQAVDGPAVDIAQVAVAIGLLALSEYLTPRKQAARRARTALEPARRSVLDRWRERAATDDGRYPVMIALAVIAATIELVSMLPYLAAIGILTTNGVSFASGVALLAGYAAVMIAPATVLAGIRFALGERASRLLRPMNAWLAAHSGDALSWVVGIVAVLLFLDGVSRLFAR